MRVKHLVDKKNSQEKITMLTAYDYLTAALLDQSGVDIVFVGDSLGNVFSGFSSTLPVTMDAMIYHTQAVSRGVKNAFLLTDMPFMSYQVSIEQARKNAGRLIQEGGASGVKIELNSATKHIAKVVVDAGIPVMAHLGLTPQAIHQMSGYRIQGTDQVAANEMITLAKELEEMGCFSVLLELVPTTLARVISETLSIPVIGIGAGSHCDGQVLVTHDLLGLTLSETSPKFVRRYAHLSDNVKDAVTKYVSDVKNGQFPTIEESY